MTVVVLLIYIGVAIAVALDYADTPWAMVHIAGAVSAVVALIEALRLSTLQGDLEREHLGPGEPDKAEIDIDEEEW